jgi:replicative DNA helicase
MSNQLKNKIEYIINHNHYDENEMHSRLKQLLIEFELIKNSTTESKPISTLIGEKLLQFNAQHYQQNIIKTGFADIDQLIGGFSLGELIVIGGRPSMGKTQLLINLSLNISVDNPVLYFTFDLSEFILTNRIMSSLSGIAIKDILHDYLTNEEKDKLHALGALSDRYKIYINENLSNSIAAIRAHCEMQIKENGVKVIVIDHLQMMGSIKYKNSRELEISYICKELKKIAKEFNVCVIISSQLSRAVEYRGESKIPLLSDLRESGAIEQVADKVLFIYRPDYYGIEFDEMGNSIAGLTELVVAKNTTGSIGNIKLIRNAKFTNFEQYVKPKTDFDFSSNRLNEFGSPF